MDVASAPAHLLAVPVLLVIKQVPLLLVPVNNVLLENILPMLVIVAILVELGNGLMLHKLVVLVDSSYYFCHNLFL